MQGLDEHLHDLQTLLECEMEKDGFRWYEQNTRLHANTAASIPGLSDVYMGACHQVTATRIMYRVIASADCLSVISMSSKTYTIVSHAFQMYQCWPRVCDWCDCCAVHNDKMADNSSLVCRGNGDQLHLNAQQFGLLDLITSIIWRSAHISPFPTVDDSHQPAKRRKVGWSMNS